ncbi:MAG: GatB/YqeY domain-containing protein [Prolixibacteraceae bacterium]|nr:GatB/YqeY domain-containing protein [Prolixibacteraceae bacterium]
MKLFEQISKDLMAAMKSRDKKRLQAIRNIKKALIEEKSAKGSSPELEDTEVISVIQKLAKQGKDSAAIYKDQKRDDLAQEEMDQVVVLEEYLPKQMNDSELTEAVKEIISALGASGMKDMGKVMGIASKKLAGKANGKDLAAKVRAVLS